MSVLMFYARIFGTVKGYRLAIYSVGFVIVGWWVAIDFLALFACSPIEKAWLPVDGHCLDTQHDFIAATSTNIFADLLLLILPMPMLWKLHIDKTRRLALLGIFTCGYWYVQTNNSAV
jgi:urea transporter